MKVLPLVVCLPLTLASLGCADQVQSQTTAQSSTESVADSGVDEGPVRTDVPYVPTSRETVTEMLRLAKVDEDDLVYDLGSGDGRIVITAARDYGARGVGIDIDPQRIREANENAEHEKVTDRVRFIRGDLFEADFSDATAVTLYLLPSVNLRLRPKLLEELKPGTPVVSHDFDMREWEADEHVQVGADDVYLWIIPAKVDGVWRWSDEGRPVELDIEQVFQKFSGVARMGGETLYVRNGRVDGEELTFELARNRDDDGSVVGVYSGRIQGDTISGNVAAAGRTGEWRARR